MQVLLISIACLLIITLIFVVFPSSMTVKGRLLVVILAFILSNIGFAIQYLYENLMLSLGSILLLVLLLPLFMQKRSRFFFKEEIHSEYITTFTAKDMNMNKQNEELEEVKEISNNKSDSSLENEDNVASNSMEGAEEIKMDQEEDFPLKKWNQSSENIIILDDKKDFNKQEEVKEWSYVKLDSVEESLESPPKEDYWQNDNVFLRGNSIEAFLEEIHANKDNEEEEGRIEEIEEKPNRRYLERLGKIRILDNSDSPKDND